MSKYLPIAERLREERERMGLNQADFAAIAGATRKTQYNYETGERAPDAGYLADIAAAGADVQYILVGVRAMPAIQALTKREAALLDNFRNVEDDDDKKCIERTAFLAAQADKEIEATVTKRKARGGE